MSEERKSPRDIVIEHVEMLKQINGAFEDEEAYCIYGIFRDETLPPPLRGHIKYGTRRTTPEAPDMDIIRFAPY